MKVLFVFLLILGVAAEGLQGKPLFPMASSTACQSTMKLINAKSFPTSLQFLCCSALRRYIPDHLDVLGALPFPPGLRDFLDKQLHWLLRARVNHCNAKLAPKVPEKSPAEHSPGTSIKQSTSAPERSSSKRYQGEDPEDKEFVPVKKKCLD